MAQGTPTRNVPTVEPRVAPAGRAVLLLAVCSPHIAGRRLVIEGRRIQAVRFGRLALLISFTERGAYRAGEVERKRGDAASIAAEARLLETAVQRIAAASAVLPMRLFTTFEHTGALEEAARKLYPRWLRALSRLGTKRECLVHLYAGPHTPPGGEPYIVRVTPHENRSMRPPALRGTPAREHAQQVWRDCAALALSVRRVPTGGRKGALWSAALLLPQTGVVPLGAVLERSVEAGAPLGVTAYLEAARAPFSFV